MIAAATQLRHETLGLRTMRALIVLMVVSASTPAWALMKRLPEPSCEVAPSVFPRDGATNVPRNAHAWITAGTLGDYRLRTGVHERQLTATVHEPFRIIELPLGELEANTTYSLVYGDDVISRFTTGETTDVSIPEPPRFWEADAARYHVTHVGDLTVITMMLTSEPSMPMMKVTVHSKRGERTIIAPWTLVRRFGAECAGLVLEDREEVCFDVATIDPAGNRSAAAHQCTLVGQPKSSPSYPAQRDERDSGEVAVLLGIGAFGAFAFMFLRARSARDALARRPLVPIGNELVRRIAIAQRRRAAWTFVAGAGGALLLLAQVAEAHPAAILASMPLGFAVVAVGKLGRMGRLLASLEAPEVTTSYDGSCYAFTQSRHWIVIYPLELELVTKAAVPVAKVR